MLCSYNNSDGGIKKLLYERKTAIQRHLENLKCQFKFAIPINFDAADESDHTEDSLYVDDIMNEEISPYSSDDDSDDNDNLSNSEY